MNIKERMIQHKVILDLSPGDTTFTGTPEWMNLELHKDGEWWCDYQGFLDADQLKQLRSEFEVREHPVGLELLKAMAEAGEGRADLLGDVPKKDKMGE